jgi:hypothetical protein
MTTPAPSTTLAASSVTFNWNAGCGVTEYYLYVGSAQGSNNLYGQDQGTRMSALVTNLPTNGSTLYVRLWSLIAGVWNFIDYTYTASGANGSGGCTGNAPATITSPTPSTTLTGASATFTWTTGTCATSYTLSVGNETGGAEIFTATGTAVTATVSNLPTAGQTIFVRLTTTFGGTTQSNDYTYTAFSTGSTGCGTSALAAMTSPTPSSALTGSSATFTWSAGCNINQYYLYVGTTAAGNDLFGSNEGSNLSATVTGLPITGQTLYVRLWSYVGIASGSLSAGWHFIDYTYTASTTGGGGSNGCGTPVPAQITSPTPGSTLPGASVTFTWGAGTCVSAYTLSVGTSVGASNIFQSSTGVSVTVNVTTLPTNGQTVYVRLSSLINGTNQNVDYTYTAASASSSSGCGSLAVAAAMQTPTPGSTLPGGTATFTWNAGCNAGQYYLYIGSAVGANDIYSQTQGTSLTGTVSGLPVNGQTLYVRLWSLLNTAASDLTNGWHYNDYTYIAQ